MAFNINNFIANINDSGVAKSGNFEVVINRPGADAADARNMTLRTAFATAPGRRIDTTEIKDYGVIRWAGYAETLEDVTIRILLSEDLREKLYFEKWFDEVVGDHRSNQINNRMYDFGYYDDYCKNNTVTITQFDATGKPVHFHQLLETFPVQVGDVDGTWADDTVLYLDVTFKYRHYTSNIISQG